MEKFKSDIYKLIVGDTIYYNGKKHTIEVINKNSQGIIKSITTNTHHLIGYNIFTTDKSKKLINQNS